LFGLMVGTGKKKYPQVLMICKIKNFLTKKYFFIMD